VLRLRASARERIAFQGLPARICWLGYGERAEFGQRMNHLVKAGKLEAPIVIGRDHLDAGSVASPNRETEGMKDGSDAIADWAILNALVKRAYRRPATTEDEMTFGKGALLWLIGVPLPIILLLALFWHN